MDESDNNSNKSQAEGEVSVEKERNVIMGMQILRCSVCLVHHRPEIFQCSCGHFICKKCHHESPKKMCNACSGRFSQRAYGMERVVKNILFPCKYECGMRASNWHETKQHETDDCLNGPDFCPADGCEFEARKAALLEHMATVHKSPTTIFRYGVQFDLPAVPGYRLLRGEDDDVHVFLLNVLDSLNNGQHSLYIEPVGLCDDEYDFGCSVYVLWENDDSGRYQYRSGPCDDIILMDPTDCLCIFRGSSDLVLKTTMKKKANDELDKDVEEEEDNKKK